MKNLVLFGREGVPGREWGLLIKDGTKVFDIHGDQWDLSIVIIEPRLMGGDRLDWHWDAISRGGASLWDCIAGDIESFWWRLGIYRDIRRNYKRLYS